MNEWLELVFPTESLSDKELIIEDDRADAITDPFRWQILETLGSGKSIATMAQELSVTDARILYHLRHLEQTGIVRLEDEVADPRELVLLADGRQNTLSQVATTE